MRRVLLALLLVGGLYSALPTPPLVPAHAEQPVKTIEPAPADPVLPDVVITAPTRPAKRGRQIVFGVEPFKNPPQELLSFTYVWVITPDPGDVFMLTDNSRGSFGTGIQGDPTQYTLTLVTNFLFLNAQNKASLRSTKTTLAVFIEDPVPPGPVPPGPVPPGPVPPGPVPPGPVPPGPVPPGPTPGPLPAGKFGLAQFIFDQTVTLPKAECSTLAKELQVLCGELAEGAATPTKGIRTKAELVRRTAVAFNTALGSSLPAWKPALDALAKKMDALAIKGLPDMQQAYQEVATGLEAHP